MSLRAVVALLLAALLGCALPAARGQDLDLSDALADYDHQPTPKAPKKPNRAVDDFNLEDALGGGGGGGGGGGSHDLAPPNPPKPRPNPNPNHPGTSGGFSDTDLVDGTADGGGGGRDPGNYRREGEGETQADSPGMISGIIGTVVVAVAGAVSTFIAYQKKKLCFKENADQAEMNMENQHRNNTELPVHQTLLQK